MYSYISEYHQKIKDKTIVTSNWIMLLFDIIINDLNDGKYHYDEKKAHKAIRFIETFVHHVKGELAPNTLTLELWQKAIVSCMFGLVDNDGYRIYREVFIVVGRKNGKSLFASGIACYMAFLDGEYGADIYCIAPKLDQADIVYDAIWQTIQAEPELMALSKSRKSDKYIESTNTVLKKIAFNAKKADGFNPHLTICDEIASWPAEQGLKQYEVMKSALGARKQPLILSISTSGYVNDGIYDELMKRSTRFLMGESKETKLLPFLYIIDDVDKWNDIHELEKSNPNMGISVNEDFFIEEIAVAEGSLSKKAEFLTKYCNIKQSSSQAWLNSRDVEKCRSNAIDLNDFRECYCVGGIDLSRTTDLTSACILIEKDEQLYIISKFWLPSEHIDDAIARDGVPYRIFMQRGLLEASGDNFVDYNDCFNWFRQLVEQYHIYPLQIGYDRYCANYLVQSMKEYGFHMDDVYQGFNLTPVIREVEGYMRDGRYQLGDNDLLMSHLLNAALKSDNELDKFKLVKLNQYTHIDGTAALLDAMTVRQKYWQEIGEQLKNIR